MFVHHFHYTLDLEPYTTGVITIIAAIIGAWAAGFHNKKLFRQRIEFDKDSQELQLIAVLRELIDEFKRKLLVIYSYNMKLIEANTVDIINQIEEDYDNAFNAGKSVTMEMLFRQSEIHENRFAHYDNLQDFLSYLHLQKTNNGAIPPTGVIPHAEVNDRILKIFQTLDRIIRKDPIPLG